VLVVRSLRGAGRRRPALGCSALAVLVGFGLMIATVARIPARGTADRISTDTSHP
jgi:hypothetical protein